MLDGGQSAETQIPPALQSHRRRRTGWQYLHDTNTIRIVSGQCSDHKFMTINWMIIILHPSRFKKIVVHS